MGKVVTHTHNNKNVLYRYITLLVLEEEGREGREREKEGGMRGGRQEKREKEGEIKRVGGSTCTRRKKGRGIYSKVNLQFSFLCV